MQRRPPIPARSIQAPLLQELGALQSASNTANAVRTAGAMTEKATDLTAICTGGKMAARDPDTSEKLETQRLLSNSQGVSGSTELAGT